MLRRRETASSTTPVPSTRIASGTMVAVLDEPVTGSVDTTPPEPPVVVVGPSTSTDVVVEEVSGSTEVVVVDDVVGAVVVVVVVVDDVVVVVTTVNGSLDLAHAGIEVAMGEHLAFHAGVSPADRGAATPSLLVVDEAGLPTVAERPGWRVVTVCDPLTPAERAELTTLLAQGELMPAERQRAFALRARSARFALLAAS